MPSLVTRQPAPTPVSDQLSRLPPRIPQLPEEVFARFPSLRSWQEAENKWWSQTFMALQISNGEISQHATKSDEADDVLGVEIREETEEREEADGFLSGKYTLQVIAGDVVTGMVITSATAPDAGTVSDVTFQADRFQIYSGTTKKVMFVADAVQDKVRLGDVFTVDSAANAIYVKTTAGAGSYNDSGTPFFVDDAGRMSLGTGLVFDGSNLTISGSITATTGDIGGWTISATTLYKNNAILDSAGQLVLGTSNDVVYLSATDATYRIWIGNAAAGSAAFRVTKAGVMAATGASISGTFSAGTGTTATLIDATGFFFGDTGSTYLKFTTSGGFVSSQWYVDSTLVINLVGLQPFGAGSEFGRVIMYAPGGATYYSWRDYLGLYVHTASGDSEYKYDCTVGGVITGNGSGITTLNATNISSGTINTARLPSTINIATAYQVAGNNVVGARGTKGAGTITEVVALLDAWGAWA